MTLLWAAAALLAVPLGAMDTPLLEGNPKSAVRVLIYEDLQCSDCARFREMLDQRLLPAYGTRVAFEHRDFPLPKHNWARDAAIASRFFQRTSGEIAVRWRQAVLRDMRSIQREQFAAYLRTFARQQGIDPNQAEAALDDKRLASLVQADYDEGVARGVSRTPTVLIHGDALIETFTYEQIAALIEKALAEQGVQ
jgi:protein-disulfide isomerase